MALCVFAAIYFVFDIFVFQGLQSKRGALELRFNNINSEMTQLSAQEHVLSKAMLNNPSAKKQREIIQLDEQLLKIDQQLSNLSVGLVSAEKLPEVLREVLKARSKVQLVGLQSLNAERLRLSAQPDEKSDQNNVNGIVDVTEHKDQVGIFKHRVLFKMRGRYFDIAKALKELEGAGWDFYWSELEYQVDTFPYALVQLEAYTLSTEKGYLSE